ncbi:MAG TPA: SRPBCC domain-containing protein [Rhizomicrobium sp.]
MKILAGMLVAAMLLPGTPVQTAVKDDSFKDANGARVLKESVVVDAPPAAVWMAFTVDDRFVKWSGVPVAHVTPGNDGLIEFGLMPGSKIGDPGNVKNRLLVYLPDSLLVWRNEFVPAGGPFDPATFATVRTMIALAPVGGDKTMVTETVIGFADGAKYDELYAHLRGGNAQYLTSLANSFHTGK